MASIVVCPGCGARYEVRQIAAAKQVRCKKCGKVWDVGIADAASAPAKAQDDLLDEKLAPAATRPAPTPAPAGQATAATKRCANCNEPVTPGIQVCPTCRLPVDGAGRKFTQSSAPDGVKPWVAISVWIAVALPSVVAAFGIQYWLMGAFAIVVCFAEAWWVTSIFSLRLSCRLLGEEQPPLPKAMAIVSATVLLVTIAFCAFAGGSVPRTLFAFVVAELVGGLIYFLQMDVTFVKGVLIYIAYQIVSTVLSIAMHFVFVLAVVLVGREALRNDAWLPMAARMGEGRTAPRESAAAPGPDAAVVKDGIPESLDAPALLAGMESPNVGTRAASARNLGRMRDNADEAVPALQKALSDSEALVREGALDGLTQLGPLAKKALPEVRQRLGDDDPRVQTAAVKSLLAMGPEAVPALAAEVEENRSKQRGLLLAGLKPLVPHAQAAIPALVAALVQDKATHVREITDLLREMKTDALAELPKALTTKSWEARKRVIELLVQLGDTRQAAAALVKTLGEDDPKARSEAVRLAVSALDSGAAPEEVSTVFSAGSRSQDQAVRDATAAALARGGQAATAVCTSLLRHKDPEVRLAVLKVLRSSRSAPELLGPVVQQLMADPDERVQSAAILLIARFPSLPAPSEQAMPGLQQALKNSDPEIRRAATTLLVGLGVKAVPTLLEASGSVDREVAAAAREGLRRLGPAATPELEKAIAGSAPEVSYRAVEFVAQGGPDAIPLLIVALGTEHEKTRFKAVEFLRSKGPAAKEAIPALQGLYKDANPGLRRAALEAVNAIKGTHAPSKGTSPASGKRAPPAKGKTKGR